MAYLLTDPFFIGDACRLVLPGRAEAGRATGIDSSEHVRWGNVGKTASFMITTGLLVGASAVTGIAGAVLGWVLRSQVVPADAALPSATELPPSPATPASTATTSATANDPSPQSTMEIVSKLLELTENVTSSLNQHNGQVTEINKELTQLENGDTKSVVLIVAKLVESNRAMQSKLETSELKLQAQQRELQTQTQAALTDPLTKLTNRRALDMQMKRHVADFQTKGRPFSTMLIDIDHFKKFNDTHGHLAGDEVLKYVASTLKAACDDTMTVARYGGEEFSVVAPGEPAELCMAKLDQIRAALQKGSVTFEGKQLSVTASAGIAELRIGEDQTQLFKRADIALYASKAAGRNCAHFHDGSDSILVTGQQASESAPPMVSARQVEATKTAEIRRDSAQKFPSADVPAPVARNYCLPAEKSPLIGFSEYEQIDINFRGNIERRTAETKRDGSTFSLVLAQLDNFIQLESDYGQAVGETVLKVTSQFLRANMRDMDHLVRVGRCGFALMLPSAHGIDAARVVGEHLRKTVAAYELPSSRGAIRFTISVGTSQCSKGDDPQVLFERAKGALEASIGAGGNRGYLHDGEQLQFVKIEASAETKS